VRGIGPKDETEALLAAQMAAIHNATMCAARRLNHAETIAQQDSASNAFNKLARTFAAQLEALKRYRSSSEPTVKTTQHVTVNDGGQAIVGNVQHGGDHENPSRSISSDQPGGALAPGPALLSEVEEVAPAMPGAGGERQEGVPVPRGARRRAKRLG
jgi:S-adenosylhomocysteine hydrolase